MRVKRGTKRTKRRKKILKQAKGFYGGKSRNFRVAKEAVERSMQFAYRDRRNRKRDFRRLWIVRINAGARQNGLSYNRFMHGLALTGCELNRKMLADLAVRDPEGFAELAKVVREALGEPAPPPAAEPRDAVAAEEPAEAEAAAEPEAEASEDEPADEVAEAVEQPEAEAEATAEPEAEASAQPEIAEEPAEAEADEKTAGE